VFVVSTSAVLRMDLMKFTPGKVPSRLGSCVQTGAENLVELDSSASPKLLRLALTKVHEQCRWLQAGTRHGIRELIEKWQTLQGVEGEFVACACAVRSFLGHFALLMLLLALAPAQATTVTITTTGAGTWTVPANVTSVTVEVWGAGGAGGGNRTTSDGGGGGGGGGYSLGTVGVSFGTNPAYFVGAGGTGVTGATGNAGGQTYFGSAATVQANGGAGGVAPVAGNGGVAGAGGALGVGSTRFAGGNGGTGRNAGTGEGGPGGSSAGNAANGTSGPTTWSTVTAAAAPANGGIGGNGGVSGSSGSAPASGNGGGGGGAGDRTNNGSNRTGGDGADGKIVLTYWANQATLTVTGPASVTYGSTGSLTSSGGSGTGAVTYSAGASTGCTVAGSTLSVIDASGTCTVTVTKAADNNYNATTSAAFTVTLVKANQTLSFTSSAPPATVGGATYMPSATATSGLAVAFTVDATSSSVCTISAGAVSFLTVGTCTIAANQGGNGNYNAASQVQQAVSVNKGSQTITFGTVPTVATGGTATVSATGGASGNPVTFTSTTTGVCTVSGSTVTGVAVGTCTIAANQLGSADYNAAPQATQSFAVTDSLCFVDDFNRASLLSSPNWTRTKSVGTTFDADIVNNRLRLTDAGTNEATAVHLARLFPGFGNKVVAEFDYFSYNGNGADGVAITLSDASVAPAAGAYGGSLGYAQKTGIPGFAGGWIGIGLDEFGNYSNPTEGRVDGPGVRSEAVTVRGSGSDQTGYNFHAYTGSAALSPTIDSPGVKTPPVPAPGHRYRVTVDHSDSLHAWVTVDRDTTGSGNSYATLIPTYDAKAISSQAAVPTNWFFSFTGSTGSSTNIHEIDNLKVCTAQPQVIPVLDHVRIIHDGSALTCAAETITLRACANATCSALYTGSVTVNLNTISGASWSSNPVTFSGGEAQLTLTKTTTGTVTLGGNVTAPVSMAAVCYNGSTSGDCSLTYSSSACAFDAVEPGQAPGTPIFTKLAGTAFTVDVLALTNGAPNTGYNSTVTVGLVDMTVAGRTAATCSSAWSLLASPTNSTSWSNGRRTYTFNYPNAARDVRVRIVGGSTACSSDNFAIRPTSFSVISPNASNTAPTGTPTFKAGADAFELDATSLTNYTGTAWLNNNRVDAHSGAVQAGVVGGVFAAAISGSGWVSKGTAFTYSEVGNFRFKPWGVYDDGSFASVDRNKATPECVVDNKVGTNVDPADPNVKDANGMYGCYFGGMANSPYFGRFIPDHFDTTVAAVAGVPMTCPAGLTCPTAYNGMVYAGQPFNVQVAAKNAAGNVTQNYQGSFAKGVTLSAAAASGGAALATAAPGGTLSANTLAATAFAAGLNSVTPANPAFTFATALTAPTDVYARAVETAGGDGVSSLRLSNPTTTSVEGGVKVVPGRIRLSNAFGTRSSPLAVPVQAQFWSGNSWVISATDASSLTAAAVALAPTTTVNGLSWSGGQGFITLAPPAAPGSIDVSLNLGATGSALASCMVGSGGAAANSPWLRSRNGSCSPNYDRDPSARATFGIYAPETKKTVHVRELY